MNKQIQVLIGVVIVLLLGAGIWWGVTKKNANSNQNISNNNTASLVTNFDQCASAGGIISGTYNCGYGGITYVKVSNTSRGYEIVYQVSPDAGGLQKLTNQQFSFSVDFPDTYTQEPDPATNGKVILTPSQGGQPIILWSNNTSENGVVWGEHTPDGDISLGGIQGKKFVYTICDGPSCTPDIVAYVVVRDGKKYTLEFYGDKSIDATEQRIVDSFKFLQ